MGGCSEFPETPGNEFKIARGADCHQYCALTALARQWSASQLPRAGSSWTWFSRATAARWRMDQISRTGFTSYMRRAELPPMRFHDLRHACASLLFVQGVHPRVVMETLGLSQITFDDEHLQPRAPSSST